MKRLLKNMASVSTIIIIIILINILQINDALLETSFPVCAPGAGGDSKNIRTSGNCQFNIVNDKVKTLQSNFNNIEVILA